MQPFMKNVSVEYAEKAAPGGEINKSIKELKDIPVLTEDNAKEIFEKRPKFIEYNDTIYWLQDISSSASSFYYASIYESASLTLEIEEDGTITTNTVALANIVDIKPIYCHPITGAYKGTLGEFVFTALIFNNTPTPFTFSRLLTFIDNLATENIAARIMASGYIFFNNTYYPLSYIFKNKGQSSYALVCSPSGVSAIQLSLNTAQLEEISATITFNDNVNQIN